MNRPLCIVCAVSIVIILFNKFALIMKNDLQCMSECGVDQMEVKLIE